MALYDSKREAELICELRLRMKGHIKQELYEDDHFLTRFLRARSHNISDAEAMLRNHIKWRNDYGVDTILETYVPNKFLESDYICLDKLGYDLEGSCVTYLHIGHFDVRGLLKTLPYHDLHQYVTHFLEHDQQAMKKTRKETGKLVEKCIFIFNFEGFSLYAATNKQVVEFYLKIILLFESQFPEFLKRAYAINASYYFFLVWAILKPFLAEATVNKVKIMGRNGWKEELLKYISPDVLPEFLGGSRTDPDGNPMCKTVIRLGGSIPESYYSYANQECEARIPNAKKLVVGRRSKAEVTLHVLHPGSSLEWEFVVRGRDIGLSVLHRDADREDMVVIPWQKIETGREKESGMCQCKAIGMYVIEFDNTYSWLHEKEIYYKIAEIEKLSIKS